MRRRIIVGASGCGRAWLAPTELNILIQAADTPTARPEIAGRRNISIKPATRRGPRSCGAEERHEDGTSDPGGRCTPNHVDNSHRLLRDKALLLPRARLQRDGTQKDQPEPEQCRIRGCPKGPDRQVDECRKREDSSKADGQGSSLLRRWFRPHVRIGLQRLGRDNSSIDHYLNERKHDRHRNNRSDRDLSAGGARMTPHQERNHW